MNHSEYIPPYSHFELLSRLTEEKRFLKGEDIAIGESIVVPTGKSTLVPVIITPDVLPKFSEVYTNPLAALRTSTRSRYAQLGLDVDDFIGVKIARKWSTLSQEEFQKGFLVDATVTNWSQRKVFLEEGTRLFRLFYWNQSKNHVTGRELVDAVRKKEIAIEGQYGVDWMWRFSEGKKEEDAITGIFLKIGDERLYIPPGDESVQISDSVKDFRAVLSSLHTKAPSTSDSILTFGMTPKLSLGEYEGILQRGAVIVDEDGSQIEFPGVHINSLLIDGAIGGVRKTNWPIVVEIFGPTDIQTRPEFVEMNFAMSSA